MNCRTGIHALLMSLLLTSSISSAEMVESASSSLSKSILRGGSTRSSSRVHNGVNGDVDVLIHSAAIERHLNGTGERYKCTLYFTNHESSTLCV